MARVGGQLPDAAVLTVDQYWVGVDVDLDHDWPPWLGRGVECSFCIRARIAVMHFEVTRMRDVDLLDGPSSARRRSRQPRQWPRLIGPFSSRAESSRSIVGVGFGSRIARNPYTPNVGARPRYFAGRASEVEDFRILLRRLAAGSPTTKTGSQSTPRSPRRPTLDHRWPTQPVGRSSRPLRWRGARPRRARHSGPSPAPGTDARHPSRR